MPFYTNNGIKLTYVNTLHHKGFKLNKIQPSYTIINSKISHILKWNFTIYNYNIKHITIYRPTNFTKTKLTTRIYIYIYIY